MADITAESAQIGQQALERIFNEVGRLNTALQDHEHDRGTVLGESRLVSEISRALDNAERAVRLAILVADLRPWFPVLGRPDTELAGRLSNGWSTECGNR